MITVTATTVSDPLPIRTPHRRRGHVTALHSEVSVDGHTSGRATLRDVVGAYVGLTKPRVIELLLLTTVPVMFFAQRGVPPLGLVLATVVGGTLSAGAANSLNCVYDRDIDEQMRRTRRRALPRHIVTPTSALVFGLVLMVVSTLVLGFLVNWLSAGLALAANAFYLFGYTMLLKRRTTQNVVWGGIAGCFPTLIGWTAVTGELAWTPVVLFLVVFFWTPPHTWALAMRYREDYARVDVPMLPVRRDAEGVARQVVAYSWVTVAVSLALWPVAGTGLLYPVVALALGTVFLVEAHLLWRRARRSDDLAEVRPMRLFHWSNMYLSLLFVAVALDPLLRR
ncbi:protoheme IX farnesyltransferase [Nocardioides aurantiacus]|uniref:Protoheme IX farnesyltransferase n=1 Tax=Nocardioides aurantiacus TaxID=86796 RepID=A0A3N2CSW6_9ACTN|nr:protoheme IX farnesyltransferase [Nocardioides aurantiacus]